LVTDPFILLRPLNQVSDVAHLALFPHRA
jgi:hypothetical protein